MGKRGFGGLLLLESLVCVLGGVVVNLMLCFLVIEWILRYLFNAILKKKKI